MKLIKLFITMPFRDRNDGQIHRPTVGTPQGLSVSCLLANLAINPLLNSVPNYFGTQIGHADDG
jgi:hypothetical protein